MTLIRTQLLPGKARHLESISFALPYVLNGRPYNTVTERKLGVSLHWFKLVAVLSITGNNYNPITEVLISSVQLLQLLLIRLIVGVF